MSFEHKKFVEIPVTRIVPNRNQPRTFFDEVALKELAAAIADTGLLQPITVRRIDDHETAEYEIIAGERRWRAISQILKHDVIEAIIHEQSDVNTSALQALIENLAREDLNPIEEAEAFKHLKSLNNWTQEELAKSVGKSRPVVANSLRLLTLPEVVQQDVKRGLLDKVAAGLLVSLKNKEDQKALALQSAKNRWTYKDLQKHVDKLKNPEGKPARASKPKIEKTPIVNVSTSILVVTESAKQQEELAETLKELGLKFFRGEALSTLLEG